MVYHTIKPQLLIALTILYAQLDIGITSSCMFNKIHSIGLTKKREEHEIPPAKKSISRFACLPVCPPRKRRGAVRSNPYTWKVLSRSCPLCV